MFLSYTLQDRTASSVVRTAHRPLAGDSREVGDLMLRHLIDIHLPLLLPREKRELWVCQGDELLGLGRGGVGGGGCEG